ncbi:putative chromo domain-like protein [Diplodia seriata]|uniref:Putative chromo domain-like protein n=1 Tax=Diplodia seriata TaxID=420778 RepID=A0A0G2EU70_9PEZI|nr:putative chromo domain-like protein [Diplodia seriata]
MPRSKFAKDAHTKRETFAAAAILDEKGNRYKIAWKAIDPRTNEPFEPSWEPKRYANAALKYEWAAKKALERKRLKHLESVSVTTGPAVNEPDSPKPCTEKPLSAPSRPNTPKQSTDKPTTARTAREKLAKARAATAKATTDHAITQALPTDERTKAPTSHHPTNETTAIDISDTESISTNSSATDTPIPGGSVSVKPSIASCQREHKHTPTRNERETENNAKGHTGHNGKARQYGSPSGSSRAQASSRTSTPSSTTTTKKRKRQSGTGLTKQHTVHRRRKVQKPPAYDVYYEARGIVDESADKYLVSWAPDPLTGEEFADTWEPKDYVVPLMVKAWEQKGMLKKAVEAEEGAWGMSG